MTEAKTAAKPKTGKAPAAAKSEKPAAAPKAAAKKPEAKKAVAGKTLKVTQTGSAIGRRHDQEATLIGLGLNKRNRSKVLEDTPSVRGMIYKIRHLVKVEEAS